MSEKQDYTFSEKAKNHFSRVKKGTVYTLLGILVLLCALLYGISYKTAKKPVVEQTTLAVPVTDKSTTEQAATTGRQSSTTKETQRESTTQSATVPREKLPLPAETQGDWKLLLVNNTHPLPEKFPVSVKELPNGQAVDERVYPFLERMLEDARSEGLQPVVCSSYRTPDTQAALYEKRVERYKEDGFEEEEAMVRASAWVATPGTSEHQAGLSVDIVDIDNQNLDSTQENTPVSLWLKENCSKYGFIVRYPTEKNKITGVSYEPWHYRYVGIAAASEITEKRITLEEYLGQA